MEVSLQRKPPKDCTKVLCLKYSCLSGLIGVIHAGVRKGDFNITDTFITDVFRSSTRGSSPFGSNVLKDLLYGLIGMVRPHAWLF